MRQSNKCGVKRNGEIVNIHLGSFGSMSQHHLPPPRHQPHLLIPSVQTINLEKSKSLEMRSTSNTSNCTALTYMHRTQG